MRCSFWELPVSSCFENLDDFLGPGSWLQMLPCCRTLSGSLRMKKHTKGSSGVGM